MTVDRDKWRCYVPMQEGTTNKGRWCYSTPPLDIGTLSFAINEERLIKSLWDHHCSESYFICFFLHILYVLASNVNVWSNCSNECCMSESTPILAQKFPRSLTLTFELRLVLNKMHWFYSLIVPGVEILTTLYLLTRLLWFFL